MEVMVELRGKSPRALWSSLPRLLLLGASLCTCSSGVTVSDNCSQPLGLQDGKILDSQISASSTYEENLVGARNGRLHSERGGGAWCPKAIISSKREDHQQEYLEINLESEHVIRGVVTQGRFANGIGQEFAEYFMLEYWRAGMDEFRQYTDVKGNKVMPANTNTFEAVQHKLNKIIVASKIRFIPFSLHPRTVCLRVELLGCPYLGNFFTQLMESGTEQYPSFENYTSAGLEVGDSRQEDDTILLAIAIGILITVLVASFAAVCLVLYRNSQQKKIEETVSGYTFIQTESEGSSHNQTSSSVSSNPANHSSVILTNPANHSSVILSNPTNHSFTLTTNPANHSFPSSNRDDLVTSGTGLRFGSVSPLSRTTIHRTISSSPPDSLYTPTIHNLEGSHMCTTGRPSGDYITNNRFTRNAQYSPDISIPGSPYKLRERTLSGTANTQQRYVKRPSLY